MPSFAYTPPRSYAGIDTRLVAITRFLLAFIALVIIFVDPTEPDRLVFLTYGVLVFYTFYAFLILIGVRFNKSLPRIVTNHYWWIDTAFYLVFISLSSGTNSIFFFFFFFAVLTAAFGGGFRTSFSVAVVSSIGFSTLALFTSLPGDHFDLSRYLIRPMSLVLLGYLMSTWGGNENRSVRRLELLRQIGAVSNPRFGIDRTIMVNLDLIRAFYDADGSLFVARDPDSDTLYAHHSAGLHTSQYPNTLKADSAFSAKLLAPPEHLAAVSDHRHSPIPLSRKFAAFDCLTRSYVEADPTPFADLSETLEARSVLTCPIYFRKRSIGRFFVYSDKSGLFDRTDIPFVLQAIDSFIPIVENIRLVDQMATDAAEQERKKIARDIHDSIIQPYIGLQIGIESLLQHADDSTDGGPSEQSLFTRVKRLKQIADSGIEDLRNYVHGLNEHAAQRTAFRDSLVRFAEKFTDGTGINVELNYAPGLPIRDRLAAEVFQIVAEALSNVLKHTDAETAFVDLSSQDGQLVIMVVNKNSGAEVADFTPQSIASRTTSLGGTIKVSWNSAYTSVRVSIPM